VNNRAVRERNRTFIPQRVGQVNERDRKKKEEVRTSMCFGTKIAHKRERPEEREMVTL